MRRRRAALDPADVQRGAVEVDLIPAQVHQLAHPQAMAIGDQDHGGIAVAPAVALGGLDQLLDLGLGQVLAGPVGVGAPCRGNCSFFGGWCDQLQVRFHWINPLSVCRTARILVTMRAVCQLNCGARQQTRRARRARPCRSRFSTAGMVRQSKATMAIIAGTPSACRCVSQLRHLTQLICVAAPLSTAASAAVDFLRARRPARFGLLAVLADRGFERRPDRKPVGRCPAGKITHG